MNYELFNGWLYLDIYTVGAWDGPRELLWEINIGIGPCRLSMTWEKK